VAAAAGRFAGWAAHHAEDTKAADARLMLAMAARHDPELRPPGRGDRPIRNVHTRLLDSWCAHNAGQWCEGRYVTEARVLAAIMLTHPEYPAQHRQHVFAGLAGVDFADRDAPGKALALARARGLDGDAATAPGGDSWLVASERALPEPERLARLLVRGFSTSTYRQLTRRMLPPSLATEPVLAEARRVVAQAEQLNDRLPRVAGAWPARRMRFRPAVIERVFARLWDCDPAELTAAVWDRGFTDLESFWLAAEPLVGYLRAAGAPDLPRPLVAV
jgi:hypothetical protein